MRRAALVAVALALLPACGGDGDGDGGGGAAGSCDVNVENPEREPDLAPLDPAKTYRIEFETTHGSFTVELDAEKAPCNGDSLLDLARAGFFDGTRFHRIVPGFVIQGGDPTGTGTGGPGYTTVDPPPRDSKYTKGIVAMAKTGVDPRGTGGSQFFVVTAADAMLPPDYAIVGRVTAGMPVVERIGRLGDPATEVPTERVAIRRATASVE